MPKVRKRSKSAGVLKLAYVRGGGVATYLPGENFGPRRLRDYELVWIVSGSATYRRGEASYDAPAGSVILAQPHANEMYSWDARRMSRHAYFHFDIITVPPDWPERDRWPVCRTFGAGDIVRPLFRRIVDEWCLAGKRGQAPRRVERMVEMLISAFLDGDELPRDEADAASPHTEPVRAALEWMTRLITAQPTAAVDLAAVANAAAVSSKHLCRVFAAELGVSPMEAVRLLRLEQAVALLTRSNLNVKQIASRCGFASPYHFSRSFAKVYGSPPSEVRQHILAGGVIPVGPLAADLPRLERW